MVRLSGTQNARMDPTSIDLILLIAAGLAVGLFEALRVAAAGYLAAWPPLILLGAVRTLQGAALVWMVWYRHRSMAAIGLSRPQFATGLRRGLVWSIGFGLAAGLIGSAMVAIGQNPLTMLRVPLPADTGGIAAYYIVGGLIAPVTEELFFRGVVYGFFRRWGVLAGVFLSTAIFGMAHPGVSFVQITGGVVFALAYEREKCLTTPIVIHALGNLALFTLALRA